MTKHEINCTCALCMASVSRNAQVSILRPEPVYVPDHGRPGQYIKVSKSETGKCPRCGGKCYVTWGGTWCDQCNCYIGHPPDAKPQVSKSETETTPTPDFAQYTRFELEEFASEQIALVAKYQKFVLNQRAIIDSLEREIDERDKKIKAVELARDMLASTSEDSLHARRYVGHRAVEERDNFERDTIEEARIREQLLNQKWETTSPYPTNSDTTQNLKGEVNGYLLCNIQL